MGPANAAVEGPNADVSGTAASAGGTTSGSACRPDSPILSGLSCRFAWNAGFGVEG